MRWGGRTTQKRLPDADVLLVDGREQWIFLGVATDLIAALSPYVDGVDPRKRVRSVTEPWDDVCPLNRRRTDPSAGSHEFACSVSHALVDDGEAAIITDVACVFETVHGLSHRLVRRVEVLSDTTNRVTTLGSENGLRHCVFEYLIYPVAPRIR